MGDAMSTVPSSGRVMLFVSRAADFFDERQFVSQAGRPPATARSSARRWLPAIRQQR